MAEEGSVVDSTAAVEWTEDGGKLGAAGDSDHRPGDSAKREEIAVLRSVFDAKQVDVASEVLELDLAKFAVAGEVKKVGLVAEGKGVDEKFVDPSRAEQQWN